MSLSPSLLKFLLDLKSNNSREWFGANKEVYTDLKMKFEEFVSQLILEFGEFENLDGVQVKNCTYRINRDVRFTKNKDPYKTHMGIWMNTNHFNNNGPGYYIHIEKGNCFFAGGMYGPENDDLRKILQWKWMVAGGMVVLAWVISNVNLAALSKIFN